MCVSLIRNCPWSSSEEARREDDVGERQGGSNLLYRSPSVHTGSPKQLWKGYLREEKFNSIRRLGIPPFLCTYLKHIINLNLHSQNFTSKGQEAEPSPSYALKSPLQSLRPRPRSRPSNVEVLGLRLSHWHFKSFLGDSNRPLSLKTTVRSLRTSCQGTGRVNVHF